MAVSTTDTYSGPYAANGVTVEFPFTFKAVSGDDVGVFIRDVAGIETIIDTAFYSVTLSSEGGTVAMTAPPTAGDVYIFSEPSFLQPVSFAAGQAFLPTVVNEVNDRAAVRALYLKREVERAPRTPLGGGAEGQFPVVLPGGGWGFGSGTGNDAAFRADVASSAPDKGAALMAFSGAGDYAPGSVGASLKLRGISISDFPFLAGPGQTAAFNTAAINAAIAALPAEGGLIMIPVGTIYVNDELDTLGKNVSFVGANRTGSQLVMLHASNNLLMITGGGSITIENITFAAPAWLPRTEGAFIVFDAGAGQINYGSSVSRCTFNGPYVAIDARRNSGLSIHDCDFVALSNTHAGLIINNLTNGDSGDSAVSDCYFGQTEPTTDSCAILQNSSGGLRIHNTKVNGWSRGYALEMEEIAVFGNTSVLIITGNSFENCTECGMDLARIAGDGIFTYMLIDGNEIAYCPVAIRVTDDADVFYDGIISNNIIAIAGSGTGILMDGGNNWLVVDNILDGVTGLATGISISAAARNMEVGDNKFRNVSTPLIDSAPDTRLREHSYTFQISMTTNVAEGPLFYGETAVSWPAGLFNLPPRLQCTAKSGGLSAVEVYEVSPPLTTRAVRGYATSNALPFIINVTAIGW